MMKPQGAATGAMEDNSNIIIIVKPNPAAGHAELGQLQASVKAGQSQHRSYNQGLISADRGSKATLLLTIPRCLLSRLQRISRAQFVKFPVTFLMSFNPVIFFCIGDND